MIMFILGLITSANALPERGRSILKSEPTEKQIEPIKATKSSAEQPNKPIPSKTKLPKEYERNIGGLDASDHVVFVSKSDANLQGICPGTILRVALDQELIVSQNVSNPVRGVVVSENLKGAYLLGDAVLDKDLKRALITFTKIQLRPSSDLYIFKGQALDMSGSVGLMGTYHNQSAKFILGEFASAAAAGFVDAGISRSQTAQGGYVTEPSLSNAGKAGAVAALNKSTERFAEAGRSASDYTEVPGFREIQVIIEDDPTLQR